MSKAADLANLIGNVNAGGGGVNRNVIINGAMNVAQRGTSSTGLGGSSGLFTLDRWRLNFNTSGRLTMTQDSSAPSGFANSLKLACTTADTSIDSGEQFIFQQKMEGQNLQAFAKGTSDAKPFALSFYVKGNASATYVVGLYENDNNRYIASTFNVTTDWTRVEITFPADTTGALDDDNASSLELWIWLHAGTTYTSGTLQTSWGSGSNSIYAGGLSTSFFDSTDRTFFITGVQLEVGQNPTEFETEPFGTTLEKCRRYFQRVISENTYAAFGHGYVYSSTSMQAAVMLTTKLRAIPTFASNGNFRLVAPNADNLTGLSAAYLTTHLQTLQCDTSGHGESTGNAGMFGAVNDDDARLDFDAEL